MMEGGGTLFASGGLAATFLLAALPGMLFPSKTPARQPSRVETRFVQCRHCGTVFQLLSVSPVITSRPVRLPLRPSPANLYITFSFARYSSRIDEDRAGSRPAAALTHQILNRKRLAGSAVGCPNTATYAGNHEVL